MRFILALALAYLPGIDSTHEVLVSSSAATEIPFSSLLRRGAMVQNGGPNSIFCAIGPQADGGSGAVLNTSLEIVAGGSWYVPGTPRVFCIAKTADQVTGAATRVVEVP